jgi:hypothetical protein
MKKLLKVLVVAVFALVPLIVSSSASAQAMCEIGYTGPDSNNMCTSVTKYTCSLTNTNDVKIVNLSNQEVTSGTVINSGNSQTGGSTSGSVSNENGTTFSVVITNPGTLGTCEAKAVVPATEPATPVTPTTTTNTTPVQPTATGSGVASLPKTDSNFSSTALIMVVGSMAAIATLGVSGIALYRYYKSL